MRQNLFTEPWLDKVAFVFPLEGSRVLWANVAFLAEASPYFRGALLNDFSESREITASSDVDEVVRDSRPSAKEMVAECEDDSDDDEALVDPMAEPANPPSPPAGVQYRRIIVKEYSIVTFKAVLFWLNYQHIEFAPLTSTFLETFSDARKARVASVIPANGTKSKLPIPASPKSVYRLAHYLQLPDLEELALDAIKQNLKPTTVIQELLGDWSQTYDDVEQMLISYIVENKEEIKEKGLIWKALEARDDPRTASVMAKIGRAIY